MLVSVLKMLNKKHQYILISKLFDLLTITTISNNLFSKRQSNVYLKTISLVKRFIKKIINDDFVIKMDKAALLLVEQINSHNKKHLILCDTDTETESDCESVSDSTI
jgi:hypothetical protein